jgi:predicted nucleotidyltransferase
VFNPERLITLLDQNHVRYVIIGGIAAEIHGAEQKTGDVDICYDRNADNIESLISAIKQLSPRLRGQNLPKDLPFNFDSATIKNGLNFTLSTDAGDLDLLGFVEGLGDFQDAFHASEEITLYGIACRVLNIDALIAVKRKINRPKDRAVILELEAIKALRKVT